MNALILQYGTRLFGLCMRLCRSREDAEDLYQETWLKACRAYDSFDSGRNFEHWLTRICVNTYRDLLRRRKITIECIQFSDTEEKERIIAMVPAAQPSQEHSDLREAIDSLPEKYRQAIILHYFCDKDIALAAQQLSIPVGTLKSRLSRARELLKRRLENG